MKIKIYEARIFIVLSVISWITVKQYCDDKLKYKRSTDEQPFKSIWELVHLNIVITKRGVHFSHVWRRGGLALDPS